MSRRGKASKGLLALAAVIWWLAAGEARAQMATAAPGNVNINYLQGAALPAASTVTVNNTGGAATFTTTIPPTVFWLTASPDSGNLPAKVSLRVNPTGLAVGSYTAAVIFTPIVAGVPGATATTNVNLIVTAPLPVLTLSANALIFNNPPLPAPQTVTLTSSGGPVSVSAAVGTASWLTVSPTSFVVLPGGPATLTVTADPTMLSPQIAPYLGKITLTETGGANKTQTINVSLGVNYQLPTVTNVWPPTGKAGGPAASVTIFGTNFGTASVAEIQGPPVVPLTTTYYSPTVIGAVIPSAHLAAGTTLTLMVKNPAPGGDSVTTFAFTFTPTIDAAVSAASYSLGGAPGELVTLFGTNIGPVTPASLADADADGYVDIALAGVGVKVDNIDAPLIYVSQHQISLQVPYGVSLGTGRVIVVSDAGGPIANGAIDTTANSPGIFTLNGAGGGQAAALYTSAATFLTFLNSATSAAKIGDTVSLYMTGEGVYTGAPVPVDGFIIPLGTALGAMPVLSAAVTATIGGQAASVAYAGPFDGGMLGVLQVNVVVPIHTTGSAVPVVVTIGGVASQATATISTQTLAGGGAATLKAASPSPEGRSVKPPAAGMLSGC